jgi:hypothetical protein
MKKTGTFVAAAVAVMALGGAGEAGAQVFTLPFQAPRISNDVGVYVNDGPGDLAIEGILRRGALGLRLGFADVADGGALLAGVDYRRPLGLAGTEPIDLALTLGGQAMLGDADGFGAQVGLSLGYTFTSPELTVTPYLHPRLAVVKIDTGADDDEAELEAMADLGIDLGFSPNLALRFGANLGEGANWGIGLAWRTR